MVVITCSRLMKFTSTNIDIFTDDYQGENSLYFKFKGKFTEEASALSTNAWHQELKKNPFGNYVFIWDCENMNGFEMAARKLWYEYMSLHKNQISRVVVISGSIIIRNAARVMLEFFGLHSTVLKSIHQFEEQKELLEV